VSDDDVVAVEEPLEIQLGYESEGKRIEQSVAITMRTPGHDGELAAGFLFTEGILESRASILEIWHRSPPVPGEVELRNVVRVDLCPGVSVDIDQLERHFYMTSSCGVCGKASLDALRTQSRYTDALVSSDFRIAMPELLQLAPRLTDEQRVFGETGGLHASGLFDKSGNVTLVREDVGRHNAMDKLVGRLLLDGDLPASQCGIIVSGRASFELVQKVTMAGVPFLAAVGAPSSLAVEIAREFGITLVGFLRDGRFNVYSGAARVMS
jgi:FdhD protein